MNVKYTLYFFLLIFFSACRSRKETVEPAGEGVFKPAPAWVTQRPKSISSYIGIGMAEKNTSNSYQVEAKKNALYDLSSEIKVQISSNSVLYTVQNDNKFNESFNSLITMSNSENVEGYEIMDSYENEKQYWVYYTLSKEKYEEQKNQKKQQIIAKAETIIEAAVTDEAANDLSSSLRKKIKAFGILEPYLGEEIKFNSSKTKGIASLLDLSTQIQRQLQSILIKKYEELELKPFQSSYKPIVLNLEINGKTALQNFPFLIKSDNEKTEVKLNSQTNSNGEISIQVNSIQSLNNTIDLSLTPDIEGLVGSDSLGKTGSLLLAQFIQTPSLKVTLKISPVKLYIKVSENNLGKLSETSGIESFLRNYFQSPEFTLVDNQSSADYSMELTSDTKEDISSQTMSNAFNLKLAGLVITANLIKKNSESVYKLQSNAVYGYGNTLITAGINCYSSEKLNLTLYELAFQMKRKMVIY